MKGTIELSEQEAAVRRVEAEIVAEQGIWWVGQRYFASEADASRIRRLEAERRVAECNRLKTFTLDRASASTGTAADSVTELQAKIAELEAELKVSKRETDLKQIALCRANGYLADRIRDVEQLTEANRKLRADLEFEPSRRRET